MRRTISYVAAFLCTVALAACAATADTSPSSGEELVVSPQNTSLLVGVNRLSIALLDSQDNPQQAHDVTAEIMSATGRQIEVAPFTNVGSAYGGVPVFSGVTRFPDVGQYELIVHGVSPSGAPLSGHAYLTVMLHGSEVPIGAHVPLVQQPVLGDPGVTISQLDSGIPPDSWHSETVAQGVMQHRPMVLFFGDPSYCPSKTCGPTHQILEQLCAQFCSRMLFEHIETYYPAGPPGPSAHVNPAFSAFGLQTDPWVYFVNAHGIVSDRYEGPVILAQLVQSAEGTLAGRVPAVSLQPG